MRLTPGICLCFLIAFLIAAAAPAVAEDSLEDAKARLLAAYPEQLERFDGNILIWRDGTRMPFDDGTGNKAFEAWLANPDIEDTLAVRYPAGEPASAPAKDVDPGRARNAAFFNKVYGDCRKGEVAPHLTTVVWLPGKAAQRLQFNSVNGAAKALDAVSRDLDKLPASFDAYLFPSAGTYNCRPIAGTDRISAHGHGIAIDIALKHSDYWRNAAPGKDGSYPYKNAIPMEIVRAFEQHGFIWGGRWYHYDTMHFEYRPELVGTGH